MISLSRKTAAALVLGMLTVLAPIGTAPAEATHSSYGNNAVVCYVKSRDFIRCFHAGPLSAAAWAGEN